MQDIDESIIVLGAEHFAMVRERISNTIADLSPELLSRVSFENPTILEEQEDKMKSVEEECGDEYSTQLVIDEKFTSLVQVHSPIGIRSAYKPVRKIFTTLTRDISSYIGGDLEAFELLPRNIRFYTSRSGTNLFIIEDEPCIRTIRTNLRFESVIENLRLTGKLKEFGYENFLQDMSFVEEKKVVLRSDYQPGGEEFNCGQTVYRFNLSFPYIVYIVSQYAPTNFYLSIYYRTSSLTDLKDLLFKCNLLNIDSRDVCCLGVYSVPAKIPISEKVSIVIGQFWNSIFNTEIVENFKAYRDNPHLCTFLHWQYYSQSDPSFILSENFIPVSGTNPDLKSVIESKFSDSRNDEEITHSSIIRLLHSDGLPTLGKVQRNSLVTSSQMVVDIDNGITLDCGEEIVVDEKKYYIVSFLANGEGSVQQIITEDEDHNIKKFKVTRKLVEELIKSITSKDHLESYEVLGKQVKTGDLVNFPEERRFSIISKLLKDRDGTVLAKCGRDFYILENVKFDIMSEDEVTINGINFRKKEKYFIFKGDNYLPNLLEGEFNLRTFEGLSPSRDIEMSFRFSGSYNFNLGSMYNYRFFNESSVEELLISRYGTRLFEKGYRIKNSCLYIRDHTALLRVPTQREQTEKIVQEKRLFIPSFDFDIDFKVGDEVIVVDWLKPESICCIQTIIDFEQFPGTNVVSIVTTDNSGNVTKTKYIDFARSTIFTGTIRKISSEFAGIKSGFKMIAKTKVGNFLKKDCHQVIGFLTDTPNGIPLMLCSNLSTLWATEDNLINNFNFLDSSSRTFLKFGVSPLDINSIKLQPGDLVYSMKSGNCCSNNIFFALNRIFKTVAVLRCQSNYSFCRCPEIARTSYSMYGIPNPRFTIKRGLEEEGFERVEVVPSFHNTYIKNNGRHRNQMPIWVRKEEIFNVPNLLDGQEESQNR
jgi:hypothetical protein